MLVWAVQKHKEFISSNHFCGSATKQGVCSAACLYLVGLGKALCVLKQNREDKKVTGLQNGIKIREGVDLKKVGTQLVTISSKCH